MLKTWKHKSNSGCKRGLARIRAGSRKRKRMPLRKLTSCQDLPWLWMMTQAWTSPQLLSSQKRGVCTVFCECRDHHLTSQIILYCFVFISERDECERPKD